MKLNTKPSCDDPASPKSIRLEVKQLVPNLKNTKRVAIKRLLTDPDVKEAMRQITESFVLQLLSAIPICDDGTRMGQARSSLIASLPHDDCWTAIPELIVTAELADTDGATIWIERL